MQCEDFEKRLNESLDDRRSWRAAPALENHAEVCRACRRLAEAFDQMTLGIELLASDRSTDMPPLSADFAARVARRAAQPHRPAASSASPRSDVRRRSVWAVAACLAVGTAVALSSIRDKGASQVAQSPVGSDPAVQPNFQAGDSLAIQQAGGRAVELENAGSTLTHRDDQWQSIWPAEGLTYEGLWKSTGRGIAVLPGAMRRVAAWPEVEQVGGSIRPVAVSLSATVDGLLHAWPASGGTRKVVPSGDTGVCTPVPRWHVC